MSCNNTSAHLSALRLITDREQRAPGGFVRLITVQVDLQAVVLGDVEAHSNGLVSSLVTRFIVRDAADSIAAQFDHSAPVVFSLWVGQDALLWKGDDLKLDGHSQDAAVPQILTERDQRGRRGHRGCIDVCSNTCGAVLDIPAHSLERATSDIIRIHGCPQGGPIVDAFKECATAIGFACTKLCCVQVNMWLREVWAHHTAGQRRIVSDWVRWPERMESAVADVDAHASATEPCVMNSHALIVVDPRMVHSSSPLRGIYADT